MKKPILSIITVCYNEKQIEKTCKSIIHQTWQDFEWIVIDGGSTDGTLDILDKYKSRINILITEPDTGIYNAMNKGIKIAKGKYLNFMNGGDSFYNNRVLERIFAKESYSADVLYGKCTCSDSKKCFLNHFPTKINLNFYRFYTINHQSSFIRKELFDKFGLYDENYKIGSDYEKFLIFVKNKCSFFYLSEIIAQYDLSGISSTNIKNSLIESKKITSSLIKHRKTYTITLFNFFSFFKNKIIDN